MYLLFLSMNTNAKFHAPILLFPRALTYYYKSSATQF